MFEAWKMVDNRNTLQNSLHKLEESFTTN